ncbi:MAG TPA: 8-amino-7-oxononanoate synthase [Candidatus Baltobacteraceae bacterium]
MSYLERVERRLAEIAAAGQSRRGESHQPQGVIDFSSNDYLGLSTNPQVVAALARATRVGSGGARLLGGRHREHSLLEEELAAWLGRERVLLFSSGYLAALGAIATLGGLVERIYSDALNHASLIDGIRATGLRRTIYPHRQLPALPAAHPPAAIVSESLFSMDGDSVSVRSLLTGIGEDDVLLLDEAHALGVYGPSGAGLAYGVADPRIVILGTLSKALGGMGGFVAGPERTIELMINTARTFVFDTALPPALALAARISLTIARKADDRRSRLAELAERLRDGLAAAGAIAAGDRQSPIVPVILGGERRALEVARALYEAGSYAPAIRPPTVPAGTSRLRISLRSDIATKHVDRLIEHIAGCLATS